MNKEQQIVEFQKDIINNLFNGGTYKLAEALYNAGYRKTFTSDLASDTQKAFKEGYITAKGEQTMTIHYQNRHGDECFILGVIHLQNVDDRVFIASMKNGAELTLLVERIEGIYYR